MQRQCVPGGGGFTNGRRVKGLWGSLPRTLIMGGRHPGAPKFWFRQGRRKNLIYPGHLLQLFPLTTGNRRIDFHIDFLA